MSADQRANSPMGVRVMLPKPKSVVTRPWRRKDPKTGLSQGQLCPDCYVWNSAGAGLFRVCCQCSGEASAV